jgi:hypothetical protein
MSDTFDVMMAAYQATEVAERDFDALVRLVKDKTVRSEGVILVEHDMGGKVRVTQTGDHLGRKGLGWAHDGPVGPRLVHDPRAAGPAEFPGPYAFTGTVKKVVFDLKPATHEDEQTLHEHAQVHGVGEGAVG